VKSWTAIGINVGSAVMDLQETIRQLEIQKRKVELVIAELEQLQGKEGGVSPNRRGRKSMGSEERQQASERVKRYWANRREQREQMKS
jgi:hypothetical protein